MTESQWVEDLKKSAVLKDRAGKATKQAGILLWKGAKQAIAETDVTSDDGQALYENVKAALGGDHRKGDASKVRTVALAVESAGLDLTETVVKAGKKVLKYNSLSQAYAEAVRLTKTAATNEAEDSVLDEVVETISESAPKTASTPESAALVLLSKGVDGAVVAILDALNGPTGENNEAAHKAFLRAVTQEVSARIQHKAQAAKAAQAEAAAKAKEAREAEKAAAQAEKEAEKAKAAAAKPVESKSKGDANKRPLPRKAPAKKPEPKPEPEPEGDDLFAEVADEDIEEMIEETVAEQPKKRPAIKRPAVRR